MTTADKQIVLTMDAGGTSLRFSAVAESEILFADEVTLPTHSDDLKRCLASINDGFALIRDRCSNAPVAISFGFPGPAQYRAGIIGDISQMSAFRGGVALGPMLEDKFQIPVFINNDGDLFALGEARFGLLPQINKQLEKSGNSKRYRNLIGITLGTGFGGGIVLDGNLLLGDNSIGSEVWLLRHKLDRKRNAGQSGGTRGLRRAYAKRTDSPYEDSPTPEEIYHIATGEKQGDQQAAVETFTEYGELIGDAIAQTVAIADGLVVIGGGITGASEFFLPSLIDEMNGTYLAADDESFFRSPSRVFNLEEADQLEEFLQPKMQKIAVPQSKRTVEYDATPCIGVGLSTLGASRAIALGAFTFAMKELQPKQ